MKLIYIAAPYRGSTLFETNNNIQIARLLAIRYWKQNFAVLCPHMNSALFDGLVSDEQFLEAGRIMLSKCDTIVMHKRWEQSLGCIAEHEFAKEHNIEIIYD